MGLDSKSAADYSFLASIPIMLGVVAKSFISSTSRAYIAANFNMLLLSNAVAFISGLVALQFVISYIKKRDSLQVFGWYRVMLATVVLIFELLK